MGRDAPRSHQRLSGEVETGALQESYPYRSGSSGEGGPQESSKTLWGGRDGSSTGMISLQVRVQWGGTPPGVIKDSLGR